MNVRLLPLLWIVCVPLANPADLPQPELDAADAVPLRLVRPIAPTATVRTAAIERGRMYALNPLCLAMNALPVAVRMSSSM